MAITKEKKKEIIEKLQGIIKDSESVAFVNFHGLGVTDSTALRGKLREEGVGYFVAKKTLVQRVLSESNIEGDVPELDGELAIAWGEETAPARGVYDFAKTLKGDDKPLSLVGGIFEGKFLDAEGINEIASIPSLDVLRGMFVNVINAPIQGLVVSLGQIAEKKA